jgi:hypothetical protein
MSMAVSFYGLKTTPQSLMPEITAFRDEGGQVCGTLTTWMCSWALRNGFGVELHCSDSELLDLSWATLEPEIQVERMKLAREVRTMTALTKDVIHKYFDSYIEFIQLGGELKIAPYISSVLIESLLNRGPVICTFAYSTLYGVGRRTNTALRESIPDDLNGTTCTHAAVIYGINQHGEFLIADPYLESRFTTAPREAVVAAIAAASYACESHIALLVRHT